MNNGTTIMESMAVRIVTIRRQSGLLYKVYVISNIPLEAQYAQVQISEPKTWEAFKRRIHRIQAIAVKLTNIDKLLF